MKQTLAIFLILTVTAGIVRPADQAPKFTAGNQLVFPADYRKWVFLSSGLGMTYGPAAEHSTDDAPRFDNVFVNPSSYDAFLKTGKWPDKTIFILEIRSSTGKASINNGGRFQAGITGIEAEVKDETRFPGKWGFFDFSESTSPATQIPTTARCYSCHGKNAAVENTFVQFYPTLLPVATEKGTLRKQESNPVPSQ